MARRLAVFRQAELQRALRAAKASGVDIDRIEIEPATGKICIIVKGATAVGADHALDTWLAKHANTRTS